MFTLLSYLWYLTPVFERLVRSRLWFILLAIELNLLIRLAFLGFETLWNTPLGKCYNGTFVRLRTLVIVRITIWLFLASLLGTCNLASRLRNTNTTSEGFPAPAPATSEGSPAPAPAPATEEGSPAPTLAPAPDDPHHNPFTSAYSNTNKKEVEC
jgi:hypothetical protein